MSIVFDKTECPNLTKKEILNSAYGRWMSNGIWIRPYWKWSISHGPCEDIAIINLDEYHIIKDNLTKIENTEDRDTCIYFKIENLEIISTYIDIEEIIDIQKVKAEKREYEKRIINLSKDINLFLKEVNKKRNEYYYGILKRNEITIEDLKKHNSISSGNTIKNSIIIFDYLLTH